MDHKSCTPSHEIAPSDQVLGLGDGMKTQFQLAKTYEDTAGAYKRAIAKPVENSLQIAVNGAGLASSEFSADLQTGLVTLATPPPAGFTITAGFQFDVPVRFDIDHLDLALEAFGAGQIANIPLVEVMTHA